MDVSSAKSFTEEIFSLRSFIQIRKKRGPKMEPCGTPAQAHAHVDDCPFKTTHWNLLLKKLSISFKEFPVMPVHWIL